jgi:hypothetical protein
VIFEWCGSESSRFCGRTAPDLNDLPCASPAQKLFDRVLPEIPTNNLSIGSFAKANNLPVDSFAKANKLPITESEFFMRVGTSSIGFATVKRQALAVQALPHIAKIVRKRTGTGVCAA